MRVGNALVIEIIVQSQAGYIVCKVRKHAQQELSRDVVWIFVMECHAI